MTTKAWEEAEPGVAVETIPWPGEGLIRGLGASPDGLLYAIRGSGVYRMPSTGTFELFAGNSKLEGHVDGHRLTHALFGTPNGICVTNSEIFICDNTSNVIRVIVGDEVTTYAGEAGVGSFRDGPRAQALFDGPSNAVMFRETLFVSDYRNHMIRLISADGIVSSIGGRAGHDDGPFSIATFDQPSGLCVSPNNTVVVADSGSRRVRSIDMDEWAVTTIAGGGAAREDGLGSSAGFGTLSGITSSSATGKIYLVDFSYNRIRCIDSMGNVTTLAGTTRGEVDGPLRTALLLCPDFCCMAANGTLYWTEYGTKKLRRIKSLSPPNPNVHYASFAGFEELLDSAYASDIRVQYQETSFRLHSFVLRMSNAKMTSAFIHDKLVDVKLDPIILSQLFRIVYGAKRPTDDPYALAFTYAGLAYAFKLFEYDDKWLEWSKARIWDQLALLEVPQLFKMLIHFANDEKMREVLFPIITSRLKSCKAADVVEHRAGLFALAEQNLDLYTLILFKITGAAPSPGRPNDVSSNLLRTEMRTILRQLVTNLAWHASKREKSEHRRSRSGSRSLSPRVTSPLSVSHELSFTTSPSSPSMSPTQTSPLALSSPSSFISTPIPMSVTSIPTSVSRHRSASSSKHNRKSVSRSESPELPAIPASPASSSSLSNYLDLPLEQGLTMPSIFDMGIPPPTPNFFIIIEGHSSTLHVHDWVLYARWGFFRRMIDSGLAEAHTRRMVMPAGFPKSLLLDLIKFIYAGSLPHTTSLTPQNSLYLLEHSEEYDLVDSSKQPREHFAPLVTFCRASVFHPLTVANALSKLKLISEWGTKKDTKAALKFIGANHKAVLSSATYRQDIAELPGDVCRELLLLT